MNEKQAELLNKIVEDKYSVGAFAGMIFNARVAHPEKSAEELIVEALNVRITMEDLGGM